jgi:hypothetical protein
MAMKDMKMGKVKESAKEDMWDMKKPGMIGDMPSHAGGPTGKGMPMHDPKKDKMICDCMKASGEK